ncbi:MAG TPA: ribosome-associated translation inhibitor RaiA [Gemmatimonadales bacterium]|nr:ribosome-associated translation inhibitor RaiA [Gemmatimonadales bacterium]
MQMTITARHCDISDDLRERAAVVLNRLAGHVAHVVDGAVVFDNSPTAQAEIRLHSGRGEVFVATGEDKDHRSALDRAEEKVKRQLEKTASQSRRVRGIKDGV